MRDLNDGMPDGEAIGHQLGQASHQGAILGGAALGAQAAQRHYQETGDWRVAAVAGARGMARWYLLIQILGVAFVWTLVFVGTSVPRLHQAMFLPAQEAAATNPGFQPGITSKPEMLATLLLILCGPVFSLLAWPYGMGVLWVRSADRSLFRVNHTGLYRWLAPFAHRMRRFPDFVLWFSPMLFWTAGTFFASFLIAVTGLPR